MEGCTEVRRGVWRGAQRCMEGCAEVRGRVRGGGGGKNQDFMLIRFLNPGI